MLFSTLSPEWRSELASIRGQIDEIEAKLTGQEFLPTLVNIFAALKLPPSNSHVLIVGQDPYPNSDHAMGLAFSVPKNVLRLPASLRNIFTELHADVGGTLRTNGDLTDWLDQGVVLLNRTLTLAPGESNSHLDLGWREITSYVIKVLEPHLAAAILWGRNANEVAPLITESKVISGVHPSPLSAYRGFFGSKPFSQANEKLVRSGFTPISW